MEALRPLLDWLIDHTYLVVVIGTLIDATGLPFPGRLVLAGAGAVAATGRANLLVVIALAALAAMLVDSVWYLTIARGSNWLVEQYCRLRGRARSCSEADAQYFRRYGAAIIVPGRFFTTVRVVAWPIAAANGVGYVRFIALDVVAATLWASIWVLLGWLVGEQWESVARSVGGWAAVVGAVVVVVLAALLINARMGSAGAASRGSPAVPRGRLRP
jgi:membrane protein DedA with SNARE-associated domain